MIRKATQADLSELVAINSELHLGFEGFWDDREWIREQVQKGKFYVLEEEGSKLAAICISYGRMYARIDTLAVRKGTQRNGYGADMVEFARESAVHKRKKKLVLGSFVDYHANGFYEKCGFTKLPELGDYFGRKYYEFEMKL